MFQNNWPFGIGGGEAGGREARWEDVSVIQMRDDKEFKLGARMWRKSWSSKESVNHTLFPLEFQDS